MASHKPNDKKCSIITDDLYFVCTLEEGNFKREYGKDGYDTFTIRVKREDIRKDVMDETDSDEEFGLDIMTPSGEKTFRESSFGLELAIDRVSKSADDITPSDIGEMLNQIFQNAPRVMMNPEEEMPPEELLAKSVEEKSYVISKERFFQASQAAERKRLT
jgi:hypothetical protein